MADLPRKLESGKNDSPKLSQNGQYCCLIWADDLLIMSETQSGLQNMLDILNSFSISNGLKVNLDKTKVMIFNNSGRHIRPRFSIGGVGVETSREYKYLGFKVTPSGEIKSGLSDLKDRALKAFMQLKRRMSSMFKKHTRISIKDFDALVRPILLYASDFRGVLKMRNTNSIENFYLSFCKQLIGVQKQTTNAAVLLELGLIPPQLYAKTNALKNWNRIEKLKSANAITSLSYVNALDNELAWPKQIMLNLSEIGMLDIFFADVADTSSHVKILQRLKDIFHQNSFPQINKENGKLRTYRHLKTDVGFEEYFDFISNESDRVMLTRFRLSNHQLMIEKGRHLNIVKEERFCPLCPYAVEDETHFLITCKAFQKEREELFMKANTVNNDFLQKCSLEKVKFLLSNKIIMKATSLFINKCTRLREELVSKL